MANIFFRRVGMVICSVFALYCLGMSVFLLLMPSEERTGCYILAAYCLIAAAFYGYFAYRNFVTARCPWL